MSFRFRRRIKLAPGLWINISKSGLSTTIGKRGASVNFGNGAASVNLGLPGTGIAYRKYFKQGKNKTNKTFSNNKAVEEINEAPITLIESKPVEDLTSNGLSKIKSIVDTAIKQRNELNGDINEYNNKLVKLNFRVNLFSFFIWRFFFVNKIALLSNEVDELKNAIEESKIALQENKVDIDFKMEPEAEKNYLKLKESFNNLIQCEKIWDLTSTQTIDRVKERSAASNAVTVHEVVLSEVSHNIFNSKFKAMKFGNYNGGTIYLYPAFMFIDDVNRGVSALVEYKDLGIEFDITHFHETNTVPSDSKVIKYTWAKANKDGSQDKRFSDNHEIPVVEYGKILFSNSSGLHELYMVSNASAAEMFCLSFSAFKCEVISEPPKVQEDEYVESEDQHDSGKFPFYVPRAILDVVDDEYLKWCLNDLEIEDVKDDRDSIIDSIIDSSYCTAEYLLSDLGVDVMRKVCMELEISSDGNKAQLKKNILNYDKEIE